MKSVTQADIAKALGVSQTTVALVVGRSSNHKGRSKLSKETVLRIQEKAKELAYRPNRFAQVMRKGQSMQVGIIFSSSNLQVANERSYYIAEAIREAGYDPVFYDENCKQKGMFYAFQTMLDAKVAGIIFASTGSPLEKTIPINEIPVPVIGLSATDVGKNRLIRCDMRDGMLQIFRHLVDQGCRKIVLISPHRTPNTYGQWKWQQQTQALGIEDGARECGGHFSVISIDNYREWALNEHKRPGVVSALSLCSTEEIEAENTRWQPHFGGVAIARHLLESGAPLPDAIMCPNDDWAFGIACEMIRAGVNIPREMAITGFNDSAVCEVFTVPLTSVRQPTEEACKLAVELLSKEISGLPRCHEIIDLKGKLLIRDSSQFGLDPQSLSPPSGSRQRSSA